ncbi:MAG: radical SAM protein [Aureliella sp.]
MIPALSTSDVERLRPHANRPAAGFEPLEVFLEQEAMNSSGQSADCLTVLIRGSECSFRCLMCDLWKSTHAGKTPLGSIPAQLRIAFQRQRGVSGTDPNWIKLYNASNFFAPVNVPTEDLNEIASLVCDFDRVIVENHPRLTTSHIKQFASRLNGRLEVAMGLETIHEGVLESLNKGMDLSHFSDSCRQLRAWNVDIRVFVLLRPPGLDENEGIEWCRKSIEFAFNLGARHVSIIPVRAGNGAIEYLQRHGVFEPPLVRSAEALLNEYLADQRGVVTVDTWCWQHLRGQCERCADARRLRIEKMNLQRERIALPCLQCDCMTELV